VNYDAFPFTGLALPEEHAGVLGILCVLLSGSRQNYTAQYKASDLRVGHEVGVFPKMWLYSCYLLLHLLKSSNSELEGAMMEGDPMRGGSHTICCTALAHSEWDRSRHTTWKEPVYERLRICSLLSFIKERGTTHDFIIRYAYVNLNWKGSPHSMKVGRALRRLRESQCRAVHTCSWYITTWRMR
jgi:hypothetical protein